MNSKLKEIFDKTIEEILKSHGEGSFYIQYDWFDKDSAVEMMQDIIEMMDLCRKNNCDCQLLKGENMLPKIYIKYNN